MNYTLVITPPAAAQLSAMPPELSKYIREQLTRLSENPIAASKPVTILQPRGQLFEIRYDDGATLVWVSIIFRFGQDEQTLHVEHISMEFG